MGFIEDADALEAAKSDLNPIGGADPLKYIRALDWNQFRTALVDIQAWLRGSAKWYAFNDQATDPAPTDVDDYLWVDTAGALHVKRGGVDKTAATLSTAQTWTKRQAVSTVTLSTAANPVPVDGSLSNVYELTLDDDLELDNPTNLVDGATYVFRIVQDGTGGRVLTFDTAWLFPGGTAPTITAAANAVDIITAVSDGSSLFCSFVQDVK